LYAAQRSGLLRKSQKERSKTYGQNGRTGNTLISMHALDNPIWKALTTHQAQIALSSGMARRFPPEVCVFGALALPILPAYESLARLAPEPVGLFSAGPPQPPPGWTIVRHVELHQMVHEGDVAALPKHAFKVVELTEADLEEMSALYSATRPGRTLSPRLHQLGGFVGLRQEGKLVTMACLRLHLPGYREISTVCTLNGFEGRGYATAVVSALVERICRRGEQPFLTVRPDSPRAFAIYRRLGFKERTQLHSYTFATH
jgi:ribosomal protein S18 acetylase RimI-like enzyme